MLRIIFVWITHSLLFILGSWCYAEEIKVDVYADNSIEIAAENQLLREILETIEKKSGISFEMSDRVEEARTTARISSRTWHQAIRNLLRGYNRIEIWKEEGKLERIMVLSPVGEPPPVSRSVPVQVRSKTTQPKKEESPLPPDLPPPPELPPIE